MNELQKTETKIIQGLLDEIDVHKYAAVEKAIEVGERLSKIKADLKHGEWLPWVKANISISERTAREYMQFHERREEIKTAQCADFTEVRELISVRKPTPVVVPERPSHTPDPDWLVEHKIEREKANEERKVAFAEHMQTERNPRRVNNETVDEHIERRTQSEIEYHDALKLANQATHDRIVKAEIEESKEQWPGKRVDEKGIHLRCGMCQKHFIKEHDSNELELCDHCIEAMQIKQRFPGYTVTDDNKLRLTCKQCQTEFEKNTLWLSDVPDYCSDYCKYVAGLKGAPDWTREEWEKVRAWKRKNDSYNWGDWGKVFENLFTESDYTVTLGDPNLDANQEELFSALEEYFGDFDDPNRRLNAMHNVVKRLKHIANDCQMEAATAPPNSEILQIEATI
jgi:hypothetical protein